tara:strand:+ start:362 stop:511 length:150 start_codon:yes stop_codon:yes gene_type:complete
VIEEEVISHITFGMLEEEIESDCQLYIEGDHCDQIFFIIEGKVVIEMND